MRDKIWEAEKLIFLIFSPEFQHKFASKLKSKECVEDDHVTFSIDVEEEDAEVEWFKDGVPIIPDGKR